METSTVLVAGATGLLGTEICRQLRAKNFPLKVMVRSTADTVKTELTSVNDFVYSLAETERLVF